MAPSKEINPYMTRSQAGRTDGEGNGYLVWQTVVYKYDRTNAYCNHIFFLKCDVPTLPSRGKS